MGSFRPSLVSIKQWNDVVDDMIGMAWLPKLAIQALACALALLGLPGMWPLARWILARADHRPGRLYSFVAVKG